MNDPHRWLDRPDLLAPDELRVLEAGLEARVPTGVKDAVKGALLAQLPAPAPSPSPGSVAAPHAPSAGLGVSTVPAAVLVPFVKSLAIGLALGVAGTASWVKVQRGEPLDRGDTHTGPPPLAASASPPGTMPRVSTSSVPAPGPTREAHSTLQAQEVVTVVPRESTAEDATTGTELPPRQAPSVSAFPAPLSMAATASSESSRLAQARALLRNNDASAAFSALESLRRDHPRGLLVEEREVLTIEALLALGRQEAARTHAQDFLTRHPKSPHAASALRVLERRLAPSEDRPPQSR
jgi:hypothetical protein